MTRPTRVRINASALLHNACVVKRYAPGRKVIAMVKANAYGCGLPAVLPVLENEVDAFGVACLEEAMLLRKLGIRRNCILFQGVFNADEWGIVADQSVQSVIHHPEQLQWLLKKPLAKKIKIWVKANTGMHRLGFDAAEVSNVIAQLLDCSWVDSDIGLITHLACADVPENPYNQQQLQAFNALPISKKELTCSVANSAAILALPETHFDAVRPGIMLYGISPFANQTGRQLGLVPVMRFESAISAIHHYPPNSPVGYGGIWQSDKPSIIGVVPVGYGDGYPRHIAENTPVWVNGCIAPIVGRISMDMLTIDLTHCSNTNIGDSVELWGKHVPVETVALSAGTIPYELICQVSPRVRRD